MSEDQATAFDDRLVAITEGEWAGWSTWLTNAFEQSSGPFYERAMPDGRRVCAFRAEPRHMNGGGFMHGGCLLTFADSARPGELIEASGEITRAGHKTVFVRGIATADGRPVLSFTGIIKKMGRR